MNCAREDCGHAESLHSPSSVAGELPGQCWGCRCPAFTVTPAPSARRWPPLDFDYGDDDGNPGDL